jgi:hypothetical protein
MLKMLRWFFSKKKPEWEMELTGRYLSLRYNPHLLFECDKFKNSFVKFFAYVRSSKRFEIYFSSGQIRSFFLKDGSLGCDWLKKVEMVRFLIGDQVSVFNTDKRYSIINYLPRKRVAYMEYDSLTFAYPDRTDEAFIAANIKDQVI